MDRVDPDVAEFPSGRGPNQLVVYTPGFGSRTGTNIFGSESIVRQGRIAERTGGDSLIPDDGFVISGHGRGSAWNVRCCPVGARVELEGTHLAVIRDEETYFQEAAGDIRQAEKRIGWAEESRIACPLRAAKGALREAGEHMRRARELAGDKPAEAEAALKAARRSAWTACARASETRELEARGVWIGNVSGLVTPDRRRAYLAKLRSANINMILPLIGGVLKRPEGEELLRDIIAAAHEFGIEVHPWTWLPAHSIPHAKDAERLQDHPEWADVAGDGKPLGALDLANPDVRAAIAADAVWLATEFNIDGLHMDWEGMRGGFSEASREGFRRAHGYDPLGADGSTAPERRRDVYLWRVGLVDQAVSDIVGSLRDSGRDIPVSSAVQCFNYHPNIPTDFGASQQWIRWVARGQLDIACPMIYAQQVGFVRSVAGAMDREIDGRSLHYAGLILYPETAQAGLIEPHQLLEQIDAARESGCEGIVLFSAERLFSEPWTPDDRLLVTLREGPFRSKAGFPHRGRQRPAQAPDATAPYVYVVAKPDERALELAPGGQVRVAVRVENWGSEPFVVSSVGVRSPLAWEAEADVPGLVRVDIGGAADVAVLLRAQGVTPEGRTKVRLLLKVRAGEVERSVEVPAVSVKVGGRAE